MSLLRRGRRRAVAMGKVGERERETNLCPKRGFLRFVTLIRFEATKFTGCFRGCTHPQTRFSILRRDRRQEEHAEPKGGGEGREGEASWHGFTYGRNRANSRRLRAATRLKMICVNPRFYSARDCKLRGEGCASGFPRFFRLTYINLPVPLPPL